MADSKDDSLREIASALERRSRDVKTHVVELALRGHGGKRYVRELERMTAAEAAEHLRKVDDSRVMGAYLVLSEKLKPPALAAICLEYLRRGGHDARLVGSSFIGSYLERSFNRAVSRDLALIVRNTDEAEVVRSAAYASLLQINRGLRVHAPKEPREGQEAESGPAGIDWTFVDSFLPKAGRPQADGARKGQLPSPPDPNSGTSPAAK